MKHPIVKSIAAIAGVIVVAGFAWIALANRNPDLDQPSAAVAAPPAADAAAQIARGAYLAQVGNCMTCHTARGGEPYAGGRAVPTPFGNIYAPNLTADTASGIGSWTADDFWRAMHDGKAKDGSLLYPAFPYTSYTRASRADVDAMFAFFKTVPAANRKNQDPELRFPYNQRWLMYAWRALYFTPGSYVEDNRQSVAWNRGAYLAQGLGHCSACHSERGRLGGTSAKTELGGGTIPILNWYAPPLNGDKKSGLGGWDDAHLNTLLATGVAGERAVSGPMAEVVGGSLQHWSGSDIAAIALYLKSLPQQMPPPQEEAENASPEQRDTMLKTGAKLYENHCVACHQADGKGAPGIYPALAGSGAVTMAGGGNAIQLVLGGGFAPSTKGTPRPYGMPPFGQALSDAEVAAVVSYVRNSWGNSGNLISQVEVNRYRSKLGD
ncbi:MAG: Cytochrome c, class precursor [Herbaspirillum sp.]|nr:Cytochrome c, class precursor [Herbaspirillum sp.]